jgi:hypothetical protein
MNLGTALAKRSNVNSDNKSLRWGASILAIGAIGIVAAPIAILSRQPDITTQIGRHLWAGALALVSLSVMEILIALFPLCRGERWALVAAAVPFVGVGVPVLVLDALHVPKENLVNTLAPQIAGMAVAAIGLVLSAYGIFSKRFRNKRQ